MSRGRGESFSGGRAPRVPAAAGLPGFPAPDCRAPEGLRPEGGRPRRRPRLRAALALALGLGLALAAPTSCSRKPPLTPPQGAPAKSLGAMDWALLPGGVKIGVISDPDLNTWPAGGGPAALMVCLYQLSDPGWFASNMKTSEGLSELAACPPAPAGASASVPVKGLVSAERYFFQPGERRDLTVDRQPGTQYVGVAGGFMTLPGQGGAAYLPVPVYHDRKLIFADTYEPMEFRAWLVLRSQLLAFYPKSADSYGLSVDDINQDGTLKKPVRGTKDIQPPPAYLPCPQAWTLKPGETLVCPVPKGGEPVAPVPGPAAPAPGRAAPGLAGTVPAGTSSAAPGGASYAVSPAAPGGASYAAPPAASSASPGSPSPPPRGAPPASSGQAPAPPGRQISPAPLPPPPMGPSPLRNAPSGSLPAPVPTVVPPGQPVPPPQIIPPASVPQTSRGPSGSAAPGAQGGGVTRVPGARGASAADRPLPALPRPPRTARHSDEARTGRPPRAAGPSGEGRAPMAAGVPEASGAVGGTAPGPAHASRLPSAPLTSSRSTPPPRGASDAPPSPAVPGAGAAGDAPPGTPPGPGAGTGVSGGGESGAGGAFRAGLEDAAGAASAASAAGGAAGQAGAGAR
ncbi:MAG: type VI secretion lipoprotein TssJ [Deltaproteobacteria bacterium]|jgi:predicted component of type VI protein secretion system|nr:type VI secretion lipoprotein TssJ [Deltaproteobacteria bacterium]